MSLESRSKLTEKILDVKISENLRWETLAQELGVSPLWLVSALLGEHPIPAGTAQRIGAIFRLTDNDIKLLQQVPSRGNSKMPPSDPTIYRFYEALSVYGGAIKEMIHEMFGDGIMSAINFSMDIAKKEDPEGARVVVTMSGKFLPYDWKS